MRRYNDSVYKLNFNFFDIDWDLKKSFTAHDLFSFATIDYHVVISNSIFHPFRFFVLLSLLSERCFNRRPSLHLKDIALRLTCIRILVTSRSTVSCNVAKFLTIETENLPILTSSIIFRSGKTSNGRGQRFYIQIVSFAVGNVALVSVRS